MSTKALRVVRPAAGRRRGGAGDARRTGAAGADGACNRASRETSWLGGNGPARQTVLLQLVAELAERHPEQLGRLRLHASRALERDSQVAALEIVQRRLEVDALLGQVQDLRLPG